MHTEAIMLNDEEKVQVEQLEAAGMSSSEIFGDMSDEEFQAELNKIMFAGA